MNAFEKNLLNKLLDKYENSKLSKGGTTVSRSIKLTTKDSVLSSYVAMDSYKYADDNDAVLKKLESLGFISVEWNYDTFKSLILNLEKADEIYQYINRKKPSDELDKIKTILASYKYDNFLDDFIEYVEEYIDNKFSYPKSYFFDASQLKLLLDIFKNLFELEEETKKRDFSVKFLGDSKLFESVEGKVVKIIRDFDSNEYSSDEEILATYNIVKNTSYALIKNRLVFKLNDVTIDLDKLGFEYSLSDAMIKELVLFPSSVNQVITVENLTSFYSLNNPDAVVIYLAGFHNHTKQALLEKIFSVYPNAKYYHFSDIDAGGFWIFNTLQEKTGIPFMPYRMNVEELKNHKGNLKSLTDNDKKRLEKMLFDERFDCFKETIRYMLDNNVKLEQEILD